jgi:hypothetical protein
MAVNKDGKIQKKIQSKVWDKMERDDNVEEPKSPFTLGSNRGNTSYSALEARGLITPIQNKEGEEEMKQGYRGKSDSQKAKELKKEKKQTKKAAELTFTTRLKKSGLSLAEYKKTKEGEKLAADIQQRESEIQGY